MSVDTTEGTGCVFCDLGLDPDVLIDGRVKFHHVPNRGNILCENDNSVVDESVYKELEDWRKLKDPVTLHINLLRGHPARLSPEQLEHLLGTNNTWMERAIRAEEKLKMIELINQQIIETLNRRK